MEQCIAGVLASTHPPALKAALLEKLGNGLSKLSDADAVSLWGACFTWRVLGPSSLHRSVGLDFLRRLRQMGAGVRNRALPTALAGIMASTDGQRSHRAHCGALLEALSEVIEGESAAPCEGSPRAYAGSGGQGAVAVGDAEELRGEASGTPWDIKFVTWLVLVAAGVRGRSGGVENLLEGGGDAETLTISQKACFARLLSREGLYADLLRRGKTDADAEAAAGSLRDALVSWLARMHATPSDGSAATDPAWHASMVGHAAEHKNLEARRVAGVVWEEALAVTECLKIGWKTAGIGDRERWATLTRAFGHYLRGNSEHGGKAACDFSDVPAPALALVLLDCPLQVVEQSATALAASGEADDALARALARLLSLPQTRGVSSWTCNVCWALIMAKRPQPVGMALGEVRHELLRQLCEAERWSRVLTLLQPILLSDAVTSPALRDTYVNLLRALSTLLATTVTRPPDTSAGAQADTHEVVGGGGVLLNMASGAQRAGQGVEEREETGGQQAEVTSRVHRSPPPEGYAAFGLRVVGIDVPTRVAIGEPVRWTVSLQRTCESAPGRVCLLSRNLPPGPAAGVGSRAAKSAPVALGAVGEEVAASLVVTGGLPEAGVHLVSLAVLAVAVEEVGGGEHLALQLGTDMQCEAGPNLRERRSHDVWKPLDAEGPCVEMGGVGGRSSLLARDAGLSCPHLLLPHGAVRQLAVLLQGVARMHAHDPGIVGLLSQLATDPGLTPDLLASEGQLQGLFCETLQLTAAFAPATCPAPAHAGGRDGAALSASPASRVRGDWRARQDLERGCGLENLGNTCYMAAFLQVLVRVNEFMARLMPLPPLPPPSIAPGAAGVAEHGAGSARGCAGAGTRADSAAADVAAADVVEAPRDTPRVDPAEIRRQAKVVQELQRISAILLLSSRRCVRADSLLGALPDLYQGGQQQDACEVGRYLLSCVESHSDCLRGWRNGREGSKEVDARRAEEGQREGRVEGCVDGALDAQPTKVFAGLMETRILCSGCGSCSTTSETFLDLTLPVPAERTGGDAAREGAGRVTQGNVSLEELVAEVLREEELAGDEQYWCNVCAASGPGKRDAIRQSVLVDAPLVLQITLMRFTGQAKIMTNVSIPRCLSLPLSTPIRPVPTGEHTDGFGGRPAAGAATKATSTAEEGTRKTAVEYELVGVVTHAGKSTTSGHYFCSVKQEGRAECQGQEWVLCDDSDISDTCFERAVSPQTSTETPYLLFFKRAHSTSVSLAEVRDKVPPRLRAEVEADNKRSPVDGWGNTANMRRGGDGDGGSGRVPDNQGTGGGGGGSWFGGAGAPSWGMA